MTDISRREVLKTAGVAGGIGAAGLAAVAAGAGDAGAHQPLQLSERDPPRPYEDYTVRRVPDQYDTIQAAVDDADEQDLVLVSPGVYTEEVRVDATPNITIRGTDRNEVVLDGEFDRGDGVRVTADGVVVENMTARHFNYNGFYWAGVEGYRGSYLTAYNNGDYGVYAFDAVTGRFDNSYGSGHPDSAFYIGQCDPCHAVITDCEAAGNALGYSGTNAGGDLLIANSEWHDNMAGIVPNTLDSELLAPQSGVRIEGNQVWANNNADAPDKGFGFTAFGTGINVAGGNDNEVVDNDVREHLNFGVIVQPNLDDNLWSPHRNVVRGNRVRDSGRADLAQGAPNGGGNEFADNEFAASRPRDIEQTGFLAGVAQSIGDYWTTLIGLQAYLYTDLNSDQYPTPNWREYEAPPDQPNMPDSEGPPREAMGPVTGTSARLAADEAQADGAAFGGGGA